MSRPSAGGVSAGILGGVAFLLFYLLLDLPLLVSLGIGAAVSVAGFLLLPAARPADRDLADALTEGRKKVEGLKRQARRLDPGVASSVAAIVRVADRILDEAAKDPGSLKKARPFLTYYLDSTVKILDLYTSLKAQSLGDEEIAKTLTKVETMLQSLGGAFEKLMARLLADDVLNLDTEIALLDQTIKMEGLR